MDGVYASAPALQPIISTAGNPVHLHGYQPDSMLGGHITSAEAIHVTATIYPLDQVLIRRGSVPALAHTFGVRHAGYGPTVIVPPALLIAQAP